MLSQSEINNCPRDDHPRSENVKTQPLSRQRVFNEPKVLTKGWYPITKSSKLKKGEARSFTVLKQRIVLYRTKSGKVHALDSFCPHMGADLGNGEVVGENLRCFFHHWEFSKDGQLAKPPCNKDAHLQNKVKLKSYPCEEKYGTIWVFSANEATHSVPAPLDLVDEELTYLYFKKVRLFAHHHVMMTNGIDLAHFKSVHALDIKFNSKINELACDQFEWELSGEIPRDTLLLKVARFILGPTFKYKVLFTGGSITSISYGVGARWRGTGFKIPSINILWGATPTNDGVSDVDIFFVFKKYRGLLSPIKQALMTLFTFIVLSILKDDDIKAFPHMRYNVGQLTSDDASVSKFIQLTNKLEISSWTN